MKNLNIAVFFCIVAISLNSFSDEVFRPYSEERFDSYYSLDYFKTDTNYGSDGATAALPSGNSYQITNVNVLGRYTPLFDLGVYAGLNIGSSESTNSIATRKNSTLNNITLGVDYLFYRAYGFTLYGDFSYNFGLDKFKTDTDSVMNSDGADQIKIGVTSFYNFDGVFPYGKIGINYRTEGLSTLMTYGGGVEVRFSQVAVGGGVDGYVSIKDDSNTSQSFVRDAVTIRVNGGSKAFYGINPNHLDSDVYFKYIYDQDLSIKVNGGYSLVGSNSAQGLHFGATLAWGFGGQRNNYSRPTRQEQPAYHETAPKKSGAPTMHQQQPRFQEDTNDGVNQDYFKPVKPSQETYIKEVEDGAAEPTIKMKSTSPQMKEMPAAPPGYNIKLKKKKKKASSYN